MSLFDIVSRTDGPDGLPDEASWQRVRNLLSEGYRNNQAEQLRRAEAQKRDDFYGGGGNKYIEALVDSAFDNEEARRWRKKLVPAAKWNNVIARVANEKASVYKRPPRRSVAGDANDRAYRALQAAVGLDQVMREIDRRLALHDDVWVQFSIRPGDDGAAEPVVYVTSPAHFWAVCHPSDRTRLAAVVLDLGTGGSDHRRPHYLAVSDTEVFYLDRDLAYVPGSWTTPVGGRAVSGFIASTRTPGVKAAEGMLAASPCADLVAAHEAVWLQNVMLIKESASVNTQTYLTGDLSSATQGQTSDTKTEVVLPEGVSVQAVSRGVDLTQYTASADHMLERAGANHCLPPSVLHHRDSSSGEEIHLRRIPLRELREERIPFLRRIEKRLAAIMSSMSTGLDGMAFTMDGWAIDFAEVQAPLTEAERLAVFETERRLFLTSTVEEERRRKPDLESDAQAWAAIERRIVAETRRVVEQRELMALNYGVESSPDSTPGNSGSAPSTAAGS